MHADIAEAVAAALFGRAAQIVRQRPAAAAACVNRIHDSAIGLVRLGCAAVAADRPRSTAADLLCDVIRRSFSTLAEAADCNCLGLMQGRQRGNLLGDRGWVSERTALNTGALWPRYGLLGPLMSAVVGLSLRHVNLPCD